MAKGWRRSRDDPRGDEVGGLSKHTTVKQRVITTRRTGARTEANRRPAAWPRRSTAVSAAGAGWRLSRVSRYRGWLRRSRRHGHGRVSFGTVAVGFGTSRWDSALWVFPSAWPWRLRLRGRLLHRGLGEAGGVAVGATPARLRGRSRTTASSVGSGVGWVIASMSAVCDARAPPPQAAHARTDRSDEDCQDARAAPHARPATHARTGIVRAPARRGIAIPLRQDCLGGIVSLVPSLSLSGSSPMASLLAS